MKKSTMWGLALTAVLGTGAMVAAPAVWQAEAEAEAPVVKLTPAPGEVTDLTQIDINFQGAQVSFMENFLNSVVLTNETTGTDYLLAGEPILDAKSMEDGSTYMMKFVEDGEDYVTPVVQPGEYTLRIKNGAFIIDGDIENKVAAMEEKYTIAGIPFAFNPGYNMQVRELNAVELNFPMNKGVEYLAGENNIVLADGVGNEYVLAGDPDRVTKTTNAGTTFSMRFATEAAGDAIDLPEGDYTLKVKKGAFQYSAAEGGELEPVQAMETRFHVTGAIYNLEVVTPGDLSRIEINFPNDAVKFMSNFQNSIILENETNGDVFVLAGEPILNSFSTNEGWTYQMVFVKEGEETVVPIDQPGYYNLRVKNGAFYMDGADGEIERLPGFEELFVIQGINFAFSPAYNAQVRKLDTVVLNFPDNKGVEYVENNKPNQIMLVSDFGDHTVEYYLAGEPDLWTKTTNDGTTFGMRFTDEPDGDAIELPEGNYTLTIAEGTFTYKTEEGAEEAYPVQALSTRFFVTGAIANIEVVTPGDLSRININFPNDPAEFMYNFQNSIVLENLTNGDVFVLAGDPILGTHTMNDGLTYEMVFVKEGEEDVVPIDEPGYYTLRIKAGAFYLNGEDGEIEKLPAMEEMFIIEGINFAFSPAYNAQVRELNTVVLNFPDNKGVEYVENNKPNMIMLVEDETKAEYYLAGSPDRWTKTTNGGTTFGMRFAEEFEGDAIDLPVGDYTLTIAEGTFVYQTEEGAEETYAVQALKTRFHVTGAIANIEVVTPGDLSRININFPNDPAEFMYNFQNSVVLENLTNGDVFVLAGDPILGTHTMNDGLTYEMVFVKEGEEDVVPIDQPGYYTLRIKAGAFYLNGADGEIEKLPAMEEMFVLQGINFAFTPAYGAQVRELNTVVLNFPDNKGVEYVENNKPNMIMLVEDETKAEYYLAGSPDRWTKTTNGGTTFGMRFAEEFEGDAIDLPVGDYTLTIAEGTFVYQTEEGAEETYAVQALKTRFHVTGAIANIEVVTPGDLSRIEINFPNDDAKFMYNYQNSIMLFNESTGEEYVLAGDPILNTKTQNHGVTYQMVFVKDGEENVVPIDQPGYYSLRIKNGAFYLEGADDEIERLPAMEEMFIIEGVPFAFDPAYGAQVIALDMVTINFPTYKGVEYVENLNNIVLFNDATGEEFVLAGAPDLNTKTTNSGTTYEMRFAAEFEGEAISLPAGDYTLKIKEGAFEYRTEEDGEAMAVQAIETRFHVTGIMYDVMPRTDGDYSFFELIFAEKGVEYVEGYQNSIMLVNKETGAEYFGDPTRETFTTNPGTTFIIGFIADGEDEVAPITEFGTYTFMVKEGAFTLDGMKTPEIKVEFVLSETGVSGILNAGEFDVFNLNGMKVLDKATDLNGLQKGIYIVNGKKVVVRK